MLQQAHDSRSSTNRLTQLLPSSDQNILQFPHSNQPHTNRQSPLACESSEAGDDEAHKHHEETLRYLREHTSGSSVVLNSVAQALRKFFIIYALVRMLTSFIEIEPGKAYEVLGELQETGALTITSRNGMRISGSRTINFSLAVNGADLTESVSESPVSWTVFANNNKLTLTDIGFLSKRQRKSSYDKGPNAASPTYYNTPAKRQQRQHVGSCQRISERYEHGQYFSLSNIRDCKHELSLPSDTCTIQLKRSEAPRPNRHT